MISVLFPTTGRPERAERCLRGLRETTAGHDIEVIAAVDADPETEKLIAPLVDVLDVSTVYRGAGKAWNDALRRSTGDLVVFAADDLVWGEGWLDVALERLSAFPDGWGFVGFNDGHRGMPNPTTHYLMSRRFIIEVLGGVVAWDYKHSFHDLETAERAKLAGRYAWAEDAHVYHEHWGFGNRKCDDTDTRTLGGHAESERIFNQRAAAGFPIDYPPVITE